MARLPMLDEPAPPDVQAIYDDFKSAAGVATMPSVMRIMGPHPHVLQAFSQVTKHLMIAGELPPTVKDMICVVASACNGSEYCLNAHMNSLAARGVARDVIEALVGDFETADLATATKRILAFCRKVVREPGSMTEEDFDGLRDAGLTDEEILETLGVICVNQMFNTFSMAVQAPPEHES